MSDAADLIETISLRWDARLTGAAVQQVAAQVWAAKGSPGADVQDLVENLRQALKGQLGRAASPAEQMRVMEISCLFERAIGNRREALSLAKNLRHLAERKGDALQQVRAAVLLAEEWYQASEIALAIDWSRRALQAAKPLVIKRQGGRPVKVLFAAEEVALAWRMALQGGADESVEKLLTDARSATKRKTRRAGPACRQSGHRSGCCRGAGRRRWSTPASASRRQATGGTLSR